LRTRFNFLHHVKIFLGKIRTVINSGWELCESGAGTLETGSGVLENPPLVEDEPRASWCMSQRRGGEGSRRSVHHLGPPLVLATKYNLLRLTGTLLCSGVSAELTQRCSQLAKGCSLTKAALALASGTVQFSRPTFCLSSAEPCRRGCGAVTKPTGHSRVRFIPLRCWRQQPRSGLLAVQPHPLMDARRAGEPKPR